MTNFIDSRTVTINDVFPYRTITLYWCIVCTACGRFDRRPPLLVVVEHIVYNAFHVLVIY